MKYYTMSKHEGGGVNYLGMSNRCTKECWCIEGYLVFTCIVLVCVGLLVPHAIILFTSLLFTV